MMERVRSIGMTTSGEEWGIRPARGRQRPRSVLERARGGNQDGNPKCLYYLEKPLSSRGGPKVFQTLKLSPQPHSPLALGFWNLKASLRPCLTKSTNVPSIRGRLKGSTTTFTPRASKTASSG